MRLALRLLVRDWRGGELGLLIVALLLAVTTVTSISIFVERLRIALISESSAFLAADRIISSMLEIPGEWESAAQGLGLNTARTLSFASMVFARERNQLVSVKAVSPSYPLRGELKAGEVPFEPGQVVSTGPQPGTVWLDSRLFPALDLRPGDTVGIGVAEFRVASVLTQEPDRGGGFFDLGPRILMHMDDVPATEVVQPGSRITYRLLLAGDDDVLGAFRESIVALLRPNYRWISMRDGNRSIGSALDRAESFLLLGGLMGVILAGVAVALAANRYSQRHRDHVAILKTLGLGPRGVQRIYVFIFLMLGVGATAAGCALGYATQIGIVAIIKEFIPVALPAAGARPYLIGALTGFICLMSFALPPILRLKGVSPMRVIRGDVEGEGLQARVAYGFGIGGTLLLLVWYSGSLFLTVVVVGGTLVIAATFGSMAWLMLRAGRRVGMQAGSVWRLALAGMQRRGRDSAVQIVIFGLAIMILLILILVRTALIAEWRAQLPENTPNHFVINIVPEDVEPVRAMIAEVADATGALYPMIRGRVTAVNGEEVGSWMRRRGGFEGGPSLSSGRNLAWAAEFPADNSLVAGQWWDSDTEEVLVSVEEDYARDAGIWIGDRLLYNIAGREIEARIASIRRVNWDGMRPNFFVLFSPGALEDFPATWMTSFHLAPERKLFLNDFLGAFPTVTVIEVDAIIAQVQSIVERVTLAVELVLGLILISGALVLVASVQASMDERMREHALVRTLGASRKRIMGSLGIEFCALGLFAGVMAVIGTEVTVYALETQVFDLRHSVHPWLWAVGPALGVLIIGALGLAVTRRVVSAPPMMVLREFS
jgi:putative ABC transport system permease protein